MLPAACLSRPHGCSREIGFVGPPGYFEDATMAIARGNHEEVHLALEDGGEAISQYSGASGEEAESAPRQEPAEAVLPASGSVSFQDWARAGVAPPPRWTAPQKSKSRSGRGRALATPARSTPSRSRLALATPARTTPACASPAGATRAYVATPTCSTPANATRARATRVATSTPQSSAVDEPQGQQSLENTAAVSEQRAGMGRSIDERRSGKMPKAGTSERPSVVISAIEETRVDAALVQPRFAEQRELDRSRVDIAWRYATGGGLVPVAAVAGDPQTCLDVRSPVALAAEVLEPNYGVVLQQAASGYALSGDVSLAGVRSGGALPSCTTKPWAVLQKSHGSGCATALPIAPTAAPTTAPRAAVTSELTARVPCNGASRRARGTPKVAVDEHAAGPHAMPRALSHGGSVGAMLIPGGISPAQRPDAYAMPSAVVAGTRAPATSCAGASARSPCDDSLRMASTRELPKVTCEFSAAVAKERAASVGAAAGSRVPEIRPVTVAVPSAAFAGARGLASAQTSVASNDCSQGDCSQTTKRVRRMSFGALESLFAPGARGQRGVASANGHAVAVRPVCGSVADLPSRAIG